MKQILPQTRLRVIPYQIYDPAFNMAADEYLFKQGKSVLRFYGWSPPTLSFGKYNKKTAEINFEYCRQHHIPYVNRITGGKTVFHDRELTYAYICPAEYMPGGILETYRYISSYLSAALASIGIICEMEEGKTTDDTSVCFREISGYEVTVGGKKLIGSAQHRNSRSILQHGSILLDVRYDVWVNIWRGLVSEEQLRARITAIADIPGHSASKSYSPNELSRVIMNGFTGSAGFELYEQDFTEAELADIQQICPKYTLPEDSPRSVNIL